MDIVYEFEAVINKVDDMDAAYLVVPYDIKMLYGKHRIKVNVIFDGHPYRGLITRMGLPQYIIGIRKEIRETIGKGPGDLVKVSFSILPSDKMKKIEG